jgi:hypothetical protein
MNPVTGTIRVDVPTREADSRITVIRAGDRIPWLNDDFCAWLRSHGIEPENTFQVDIVGDYVVGYRYARNEEGAKYVHREGPRTGEIALGAPLVAEITEPLPPEHIEGGTA